MFFKNGLYRPGLIQVVQLGGRPMGIDIVDLTVIKPGVRQGRLHTPHGTGTILGILAAALVIAGIIIAADGGDDDPISA